VVTSLKTVLAALAARAIGVALPAVASAAEPVVYDSHYAQDRSEIEDLQARYMFALDWQDAESYAATFTPDGVLDWAGGIARGREAIIGEVHGMRAAFAKKEAADAPRRPSRLRHFITNVVIKVDGDRATGTAYWVEFNNETRDRWPFVGGYGHYEDELRKLNGHWLFSRRKIYNEILDSRAAGTQNPAQ
jgi:hypothetical protein